jgi:hypothetical protein
MRAFLIAITTALLACASGCSASDTVPRVAYQVLDDQGSQLRTDFNNAQGSIRLVFLVDPICPECLRGLADIDRDLLSKTGDPRIQVFVVHEPVIGATENDIAPAAALLHSEHVHHYWNPSGKFGENFGRAVGMHRGDKIAYAWDTWTIYPADARWESEPTKPLRLMHQLRALDNPDYQRLDSGVFADQAKGLLATLPATAPK